MKTTIKSIVMVMILAGFAACDGSSFGPDIPDDAEVAVVLNSVDRTLTVFEVARPDNMFTIGVGFDGSPVTFAVRGATAVVAMGLLPEVAIVDLDERFVIRRAELPRDSGATGVAFIDDDTVLVGNPNLDSVSPVNIQTGNVGPEIRVGFFPEFIVADGQRAYVINAELGDDFVPVRLGTVSVIDIASLQVIETIELSGENPGGAALAPDGRLFIVNRGRFGERSGSLSVVSTATLEETEHHLGFDEFPSRVGFGPGGRVLVTSTEYGIAVWDSATREFVFDPFNPVTPGGNRSSAGVGFDSDGTPYTLELECSELGDVFRLSEDLVLERTIQVGTCPIDIAFTMLGG
jgi:DNA-binding beta-propeller fold protein YncE